MDIAIATITGRIRGNSLVSALFLSGSHAVGFNDEYSDLDFLLVSHEGATDRIAALWHEAVREVGEPILWRDRKVGPSLINAITSDWLRIDVSIRTPEQMDSQSHEGLLLLSGSEMACGRTMASAHAVMPSAGKFLYQVEEFIRILGLMRVILGRKEYLNGVTGIFHLRNLLIDLLIGQTGAPHRGGALHLNRLITEPQKKLLAELPIPQPDRTALIEAHLAYAQAYLPRARLHAEKLGVVWPAAFEAATWRMLRKEFELEAGGLGE